MGQFQPNLAQILCEGDSIFLKNEEHSILKKEIMEFFLSFNQRYGIFIALVKCVY